MWLILLWLTERVRVLGQPAVLGKDRRIQLQLICELIHFKEISSSARWALRCDIPSSSLPHTLQTYMREEGKRYDAIIVSHPNKGILKAATLSTTAKLNGTE